MPQKSNNIKTGIAITLITLTISLVIAVLIIENIVQIPGKSILQNTKAFFTGNWIILILTILVLYGISFWLGKRAVIQIVEKKKDAEVVGTTTGIIIFFLALLIGSTLNLVQQSIRFQEFENQNLIFDFFLNPLISIGIVGILPAFFISLGYGKILKRKIKS